MILNNFIGVKIEIQNQKDHDKIKQIFESIEGIVVDESDLPQWKVKHCLDIEADYKKEENIIVFVYIPVNYEIILPELKKRGFEHFIFESDHLQSTLEKIFCIKKYHDLLFQNILLNVIYESAKNSVVVTDIRGRIIYANSFFLDATGYERNDLIGNSPSKIKSGYHPKTYYDKLWETLKRGETWHNFFINRKKNGDLFYEEATITPIQVGEESPKYFLKIGKLVEREKLISNELSSEMQSAKNFIHYLIPSHYRDEIIDFEMKFKAYNYLGGDFACFKKVDDHRYIFGLIDVMGHGVISSLMGLKAITFFETQIQYHSLKNAVSLLNEEIATMNQDEKGIVRYLAGVFLQYDSLQNKLTYINAGHTDLILKNAFGRQSILSNNLILGVSEAYDFTVNEMDVENHTTIFFYSDGLVESYENVNGGAKQKIYSLLDNLPDPLFFNDFLVDVFYKMTNGNIADDVTLGLISFKVE